MELNSIGIDLAESKIVCVQSCPSHYQIIAKFEMRNAAQDPSEQIEILVQGLNKNLSSLKINRLPAFLALSNKLVNQQIIQLEGDILRLKPYAMDRYVFESLSEWIDQPLKDLYLDYVVLSGSEAGQTELLLAWAEKASLVPYMVKLKQLKIKLKAMEPADMAKKRFYDKKLKLYDPGHFLSFDVASGAALREWDETD